MTLTPPQNAPVGKGNTWFKFGQDRCMNKGVILFLKKHHKLKLKLSLTLNYLDPNPIKTLHEVREIHGLSVVKIDA